jgi:hypothetical protein
MESFFSTVKSELGEHFESHGDAKRQLFDGFGKPELLSDRLPPWCSLLCLLFDHPQGPPHHSQVHRVCAEVLHRRELGRVGADFVAPVP